jgi:hypothetical protein
MQSYLCLSRTQHAVGDILYDVPNNIYPHPYDQSDPSRQATFLLYLALKGRSSSLTTALPSYEIFTKERAQLQTVGLFQREILRDVLSPSCPSRGQYSTCF